MEGIDIIKTGTSIVRREHKCVTFTSSFLLGAKLPRDIFIKSKFQGLSEQMNHLTPNGHYMGRTAQLISRCCILYIYSTNIRTEYFKHTA